MKAKSLIFSYLENSGPHGKRRNPRYYHASPKRFKVGDLIFPQGEGLMNRFVFMTNDPIPHFTILEKAVENGWHVYEVSPEGKVEISDWDDYITSSATVIRYVGSARGISRNKIERYLKKISKKRGLYPDEKPDISKVGSRASGKLRQYSDHWIKRLGR